MPDGRIGHVEVALGDSVLMLADEYPELGLVAPLNRGGPSQSLTPGGDAIPMPSWPRQPSRPGARLERPVADSRRTGEAAWSTTPRDTAGWCRAETPAARPGRGGLRLAVDARHRARRPLLPARCWAGSWPATTTGRAGRSTNLTGRVGHGFGGQRPTLFLCFAVPDVDAAAQVVRAAGGTAEEPSDTPYGRIANCIDDQGIPFAVSQGPGAPGPSEPGGIWPTSSSGYPTPAAPAPSTARCWAGASSREATRATGTRRWPAAASRARSPDS